MFNVDLSIRETTGKKVTNFYPVTLSTDFPEKL